jgi:hypothetical protein
MTSSDEAAVVPQWCASAIHQRWASAAGRHSFDRSVVLAFSSLRRSDFSSLAEPDAQRRH